MNRFAKVSLWVVGVLAGFAVTVTVTVTVIVVFVVLVGYLLPSDARVATSATIAAPKASLFPYFNSRAGLTKLWTHMVLADLKILAEADQPAAAAVSP